MVKAVKTRVNTPYSVIQGDIIWLPLPGVQLKNVIEKMVLKSQRHHGAGHIKGTYGEKSARKEDHSQERDVPHLAAVFLGGIGNNDCCLGISSCVVIPLLNCRPLVQRS